MNTDFSPANSAIFVCDLDKEPPRLDAEMLYRLDLGHCSVRGMSCFDALGLIEKPYLF